MNIYVSVKQPGKKKSILNKEEITLSDDIETLEDLISELVTANVEKYNNNLTTEIIGKVFSGEEIEDKISAGSVTFGDNENKNVQDPEKARNNALLSFKDGLFKVFIDENEISELNEKIVLKENSQLLFLKLVFLRGSFY